MAPPPSVIVPDASAASPPARAVSVAAESSLATVAAQVAFLRMLVVVALAMTGSLWPHPTTEQSAVFYVWGLGWLPWAIVVLFAAESARRRLASIGGVVGDVAVLLTSLALLPDVP